jgi:SAM-dependent methyltransferase
MSATEPDKLGIVSQVHAEKVRGVARFAHGNRILDAGCGDGKVSSALAALGFEVIGCDRSLRQVRLCKARAKKVAVSVDLCVASLTDLPFRTSSFETVCCLDVLEHIPEFSGALEELCRVVSIGGALVLAVPGLSHYLVYDRLLLRTPISKFLLKTLTDDGPTEGGHYHVQTLVPGMVNERLEGLGLEVASALNVSFLATYLETIKNVLSALGYHSCRPLTKLIGSDLRLAKHLPLALGSSWLITSRKISQKKVANTR